jgi:hypothetical protein
MKKLMESHASTSEMLRKSVNLSTGLRTGFETIPRIHHQTHL